MELVENLMFLSCGKAGDDARIRKTNVKLLAATFRIYQFHPQARSLARCPVPRQSGKRTRQESQVSCLGFRVPLQPQTRNSKLETARAGGSLTTSMPLTYKRSQSLTTEGAQICLQKSDTSPPTRNV